MPKKGRIKFVDHKTRAWGFIIADEGDEEIFFPIREFQGARPTPHDDGLSVEFEVHQVAGKTEARQLKLLQAPRPPRPGEAFGYWGYTPLSRFRARDKREYASAVALLASIALDETWHFGKETQAENEFPILENYLTYTFYRLQRQSKIKEFAVEGESWTTFNTGLVDKLYDPIYALYMENNRGPERWTFYDFCVPGKGPSGKQLTAVFHPLPESATYFTSTSEVLLDPSKGIHVDYEHVIIDGVRRDRFPQGFLSHHVPKGVEWKDYRLMEFNQKNDFLAKLSRAILDDVDCMRNVRNRLDDAKTLAEKRTRWNFKTAIPQYYPKFDKMSLLLPLALMDDREVDMALVVTRNPSGSYQGRTVLPLGWAYQHARLVCRPDSDWLTPGQIHPELTPPEDGDTEDED